MIVSFSTLPLSGATNPEVMADDKLYLGFDLSTQQLKAAVTNDDLQLRYETTVKFDTDLPEFKTDGGAHIHEDRCTVTAPVLMWIKAVDLCLEKMKEHGVEFSKIAALSGCAQQHGSVYWKTGSLNKLQNLDKDKSLHDQLKETFTVYDSPIWQDGSSDLDCRRIEQAVGGPLALAELSGSRCFHRFTGAQISKIHRLHTDKYEDTERISVVSSFTASLLLGDYAPIDLSEGCGTAFMDVKRKRFHDKLLEVCAPDLHKKVGQPVPSWTIVGCVSRYLVARFGFSSGCKIIAFTGDNMASVAGLRLQQGEIEITMGTSDCVIPVVTEPKPTIYTCQIASAVIPDTYVALICFKNSSLTRERVMRERAGSWEAFNQLLASSPRGNNGNIGIYFDIVEVTPHAIGVHRFDCNDKEVNEFDAATEVRAVLESHFLARRMYAESCGIDMKSATRLLATGGASSNPALLQVMADVFGCPVYTIDIPNSALLGNCYRAKHGLLGGADRCDYFQVVPPHQDLHCVATPTQGSAEIYGPMLERYRQLEQIVFEKSQSKLRAN